MEINGNVVTLQFVDGKRGGADLAANGEITDPGAPVPGANISSASNGSSGCNLAGTRRSPAPGGYWRG